MVVEEALFTLDEGDERAFEQAFDSAREVIARADGFRWVELYRGIDKPNTYRLRVGWDSVDAHMVGFRESELYQQWRAFIGPYLAQPVEVLHYEPYYLAK